MPAFSVSHNKHAALQIIPKPIHNSWSILKRLVRFLAKDGRTYYGDAILPQGVSDLAKTKQARVIKGDVFGKHDVTEQIAVSI